MVGATLNKETQSVTIGKTTLRSIVNWNSKIPIHEAVGLLRETRKEYPKVNFPSNATMDDALVFQWQSHSEDVRNFFRSNVATPCQEWIIYGPTGQQIKAGTVQFSKDEWTAVAEGVPKDVVERYNAAIKSGKNAALFVKRYNDGLPVLEKDKQRVVITPSNGGIVVVSNYLRESGKSGNVHKATRLPLAAKAKSDLTTRWSYTVPNDQSYVGPLVRGYLGYFRRYVVAFHVVPGRLGVLAANATPITVPNAQLQLAKKIARDAAPELQKLEGSGIIKPESIENLSELIKVLTGQ